LPDKEDPMGIGIVGIILLVAVVLAVVYFLRRA
jgi:hypothetical protein